MRPEIISQPHAASEMLVSSPASISTFYPATVFHLASMPIATKLKITPLAPTFVAEVEGVDFSEPVPEDVFHEVKDVVNKYGVAIFRKTGLDDHKLIEFGRRFGELDKSAQHRAPDKPVRIALEEIFGMCCTNNDVSYIMMR